MKNRMMRSVLAILVTFAFLAFVGCSSDETNTNPTEPGNGGSSSTYESELASIQFNDFGADARLVLPPVYNTSQNKDFDIWRDGDYALLGKVFSENEPMSIHHNIDDHDRVMMEIDTIIQLITDFEAENDTLPTEPFPMDNPEFGAGMVTLNYTQPTAPIAVPSVCQTVFNCTEVTVDHVLQVSVQFDNGDSYESPYFGFSVGSQIETLYYWAVGMSEEGTPEGSQLFFARKDTLSETVEIAGSYFKTDGPGDEDRCNWVYNMTGASNMDFTYNMGWYAEYPEFELFGCVQGSGNKDTEFGLRYHEYNDTVGWTDFFADSVSEEMFGPVDGDPYAEILEENQMRDLVDYITPSEMYHRDDSPLQDIPNPFADLF